MSKTQVPLTPEEEGRVVSDALPGLHVRITWRVPSCIYWVSCSLWRLNLKILPRWISGTHLSRILLEALCLQGSLRAHRRGVGIEDKGNSNKGIRLRPLPSLTSLNLQYLHCWYPKPWLRGQQTCIWVQGSERWEEKYLRSGRGGRVHIQCSWHDNYFSSRARLSLQNEVGMCRSTWMAALGPWRQLHSTN